MCLQAYSLRACCKPDVGVMRGAVVPLMPDWISLIEEWEEISDLMAATALVFVGTTMKGQRPCSIPALTLDDESSEPVIVEPMPLSEE